MTQPLHTVRQLAYVVRDMDAALKYWVDVLKVGPFYLFEHCPLRNQRYRGNPSNVDVTLALGNSGALQIEVDLCNITMSHPSTRSFWMPVGSASIISV